MSTDAGEATSLLAEFNWQDDEGMREVISMTTEQIKSRTKLLEDESSLLQSEIRRIQQEIKSEDVKTKENQEKVKLNKQLPWLVGNVVEILDNPDEDMEQDGSNMEQDKNHAKAAVIKTSTRQTIYLPVPGLVDVDKLKPGELVGVHKDSYLILDLLPAEYDARVKAMEVDEKPSEDYGDIGGLEKQIAELKEAVVLPLTHAGLFQEIGIKAPKGVLLYGPPGTGKTLMARACARETKSTFLKLAGPQLVQMFIGDGAKLVRDAFALAKEKKPAIIFIDQLDGFTSNDDVKVIAATNRVDILDPALLRSGRIDRKVEFPLPNEEARARILVIHSRKMKTSPDINFDELSRCTQDFNGAQLKAVCVEAGMLALRRNAKELQHEDFVEGIGAVQAKKKKSLAYYA